MIYDIVFLDGPILHGVDLYQDYQQDHLETYQWLNKLSANYPHYKIGFKIREDHPPPKKILDLITSHHIQIISQHNSYEIGRYSKICVTYYSTLGFEMLGEKKPTIFCDPWERNPYIPKHDHFKKITATSYEQFEYLITYYMRSEAVSLLKDEESDYFCLSSFQASQILDDHLSSLIKNGFVA
jgi:hypothetical protein